MLNNRVLKIFICSTFVVSLAGCGLFSKEKVKLDGERISVLSDATVVRPDYTPGDVKIKIPEPRTNSEWSQNGGTPLHNGGHLAGNDKIKEAWDKGFGKGCSKRDFLISAPVVAHGVVFAIDANAIVTARRLDDGKEIWKRRLKALNKDDMGIALKGAGLAYDNGKVFAATGFGSVFALDMKTGKKIWRYDTTMPIRIAPTVSGNRLFTQTIDNSLIALDTENGNEMWKYKTIEEATTMVGGASPAYSVREDLVVAAFTNGELRAFKASTGTPLWSDMIVSRKRTNSLANITTVKSNPIIDGDRVYAVGNNDIMVALDLRTGTRVWEKEVSSGNQPWIAGRYIYLLSDDFELIAFEKDSGKVVWNKKIPTPEKTAGMTISGPVLVNNSLIVILSDGHVYSVSPYTGSILGFINVKEDISLAPVVADGYVIFTTDDADLLAYK